MSYAQKAFEQVCRMSVGECIDAVHGMHARAAERDTRAFREYLANCAEDEARAKGIPASEVLAGWVCDGVERGAEG